MMHRWKCQQGPLCFDPSCSAGANLTDPDKSFLMQDSGIAVLSRATAASVAHASTIQTQHIGRCAVSGRIGKPLENPLPQHIDAVL